MIGKQDRDKLRQLMQDPKWPVIEMIANSVVDNIQDQSPVRDTIDLTVKEAYTQDGKVQGIRNLIQELYNQAQRD